MKTCARPSSSPRSAFYATLLAIGASSCSVDMFTSRESGIAKPTRENYRKIRPECSGLRVEKSQLDAPTFRKLIQCFNSNGSMPEVAQLVDEAAERTLADATNILNTTFLADPKVLAESREVVRGLKNTNKWGDLVGHFSPLLEDPERVRALVRLFSLGDAQTLVQRTIRDFDPRETAAGFEILSRIAGSKAFGELSRKIGEEPLSAADRDRLVGIFHRFTREKTPVRSAGMLVEAMAAGKSAALWDYAFGGELDILAQTDRTWTLLKEFGRNGGGTLRDLSRFHVGFHRPVKCWGGGKTFAEPWKNLSEELGLHRGDRFLPFITRFAALTAIGIQEICEVPNEVIEFYPRVLAMTRGRAGGVYVDILDRVFAGGFGLSAGYFVGEWGEEAAEALALLQDKSWFADLLLVLAEVDVGDRARIASWVRSLLAEKSAWTTSMESWTRADLDRFFADAGILLSAEPTALSRMAGAVLDLFETADTHPWFGGWKKVVIDSQGAGLDRLVALDGFPGAARALSEMAADGRLAAVLGDILEILAGSELAKGKAITVSSPALRKPLRHHWVGADLTKRDYPAAFDESLRACAALDLRKSAARQSQLFELCLKGGGVSVDAFAGLRLAQREDFAPREESLLQVALPGEENFSFLQWFVQSVVRLPLTPGEKGALISFLTRNGERPSLVIDDLRAGIASIRERIGGSVFHLLGRFQSSLGMNLSTWNGFFSRLALLLDDHRFISVSQSIRALTRPEPFGAVIGPAARPPAGEIRKWIRDFECVDSLSDIERRAETIGREFDHAVLGWKRPRGQLPLAWEAKDLKPRLAGIFESLSGNSTRSGLYQWLASLDPKMAARWFHLRGNDPRFVAVMDPETKELRVRWMTSLDRLESILVNSNFSYLFPANYGLKFIEKFAEAWGDEPREKWPLEIQERYSGRRRPPKLRDVYEEVQETVRWFERIGGIPTSPDCVDENSAIVKKGITDPWATAPDGLISFDVKAKAFNLRQTLDVIAENLPGSGAPTEGGMRLLRDAFWAVSASVDYADRDASDPESNPLRFFQRLGDLGGLRMISRGLQGLVRSSEISALEDVFGGLRTLVKEPALDRLLRRVVENPRSLDRWVDSVYRAPESLAAHFQWPYFASGLMNAVATDRRIMVLPALLRFLESGLPARGFPDALVGELIVFAGNSAPEVSGLRTLAPLDRSTEVRLAEIPVFLDQRVLPLLRALPVREGVELLDRDPALRKQVRTEWSRQTSLRQTTGGEKRPDSRIFSTFEQSLRMMERPEIRRGLGLWCGTSASRLVFEFARRPDEAGLMVDGLLRSAESEAAFEFMEALLRQLPD